MSRKEKKRREREERRKREGRGEGKSGQGGRSPDGHWRLAGAGAGHRTRWPEKRHGVQTVMGMRGGWRGAEACEVEWLRTWGNGASGQVGGFAGMGPGRFWALQFSPLGKSLAS
ncbi:hypothetical protein V6Z11_A03G196700 [Gossypium hirsutum]